METRLFPSIFKEFPIIVQRWINLHSSELCPLSQSLCSINTYSQIFKSFTWEVTPFNYNVNVCWVMTYYQQVRVKNKSNTEKRNRVYTVTLHSLYGVSDWCAIPQTNQLTRCNTAFSLCIQSNLRWRAGWQISEALASKRSYVDYPLITRYVT